jgi:hypothetical protein
VQRGEEDGTVDAVDRVLQRGGGAAGVASGGGVLLEALALPFAAELIGLKGSGGCAGSKGEDGEEKERHGSQLGPESRGDARRCWEL